MMVPGARESVVAGGVGDGHLGLHSVALDEGGLFVESGELEAGERGAEE